MDEYLIAPELEPEQVGDYLKAPELEPELVLLYSGSPALVTTNNLTFKFYQAKLQNNDKK